MLDEFKKVMKQYNIPAGDFPNIDRFRSKVVEVRWGVETGCGDGARRRDVEEWLLSCCRADTQAVNRVG